MGHESSQVTAIVGSVGLGVAIAWPLGLLHIALSCFLAQWLAFIPAYANRTELFYDITGSFTFIGVAGYGLWAAPSPRHPRQSVLASMIILWALRLGSFLFTRIHAVGKDSRFDKVRDKPLLFFQFWTIQGLWVFLTSLPASIAFHKPHPKGSPFPIPLDSLGMALWVTGMVLEVMADEQKRRFSANPRNKGKWIDEGLWALSRHPNYLGEITLWVGNSVVAWSSLDRGWDGLAVLGPLFVATLLSKISLPMTEAGADKRWGNQSGYLAYKARVARLVPYWH